MVPTMEAKLLERFGDINLPIIVTYPALDALVFSDCTGMVPPAADIELIGSQ